MSFLIPLYTLGFCDRSCFCPASWHNSGTRQRSGQSRVMGHAWRSAFGIQSAGHEAAGIGKLGQRKHRGGKKNAIWNQSTFTKAKGIMTVFPRRAGGLHLLLVRWNDQGSRRRRLTRHGVGALVSVLGCRSRVLHARAPPCLGLWKRLKGLHSSAAKRPSIRLGKATKP